MPELELDQLALRYCRQIIMQTMDHVRSSMREENLMAHWKTRLTTKVDCFRVFVPQASGMLDCGQL